MENMVSKKNAVNLFDFCEGSIRDFPDYRDSSCRQAHVHE